MLSVDVKVNGRPIATLSALNRGADITWPPAVADDPGGRRVYECELRSALRGGFEPIQFLVEHDRRDGALALVHRMLDHLARHVEWPLLRLDGSPTHHRQLLMQAAAAAQAAPTPGTSQYVEDFVKKLLPEDLDEPASVRIQTENTICSGCERVIEPGEPHTFCFPGMD